MSTSSASSTPTLTPTHHWKVKASKQSSLDSLLSTDSMVSSTRKWIEVCTGSASGQEKSFIQWLQDGVLLCRLTQNIQPGLIRKINYVKSPFAWRENISFFLDACRSLGLRESQLFTPEDLLTTSSPNTRTKSSVDLERRTRKVSLTLFWLSQQIESLSSYSGPFLDSSLSSPPSSPLPTSPVHTFTARERNIDSPEKVITTPTHTGSKVKRVETVVGLVTETNEVVTESFAELILCLNNTRQTSCTLTSDLSGGTSLHTEPDLTTSDSTPPSSEASTVIYRELPSSSRCSSVLQDDTGRQRSEFSETESSLTSPITGRHLFKASLISFHQDPQPDKQLAETPNSQNSLSFDSVEVSQDTQDDRCTHSQDTTSYCNTESFSPLQSSQVSDSLSQSSELSERGVHQQTTSSHKESSFSNNSEEYCSEVQPSLELSVQLESLSHPEQKTVHKVRVVSSGGSSLSTEEAEEKTSGSSTHSLIVVSYTEENFHHCDRTASESSLPPCSSESSTLSEQSTMSTTVAMETLGHMTHSTSPVDVPRTVGYPSSEPCNEGGSPQRMYSQSMMEGEVPHHSLSVSTSGPDSPSSYQVQTDMSSEMDVSFHQQAECDGLQAEMADQLSLEQTDKDGSERKATVSRKSSFLTSVLNVASKHTSPVKSGEGSIKGGRPVSAPTRSVSSVVLPSHSFYTLPSGLSHKKLREKRVSLDEERYKRQARFQEGARAALQYQRRSLKSESLPRNYHSSSVSHNEEDDLKTSPVPSTLSPIATSRDSTSSTPMSLRQLSIDETPTVSKMQMEEIWKEVEGGASQPMEHSINDGVKSDSLQTVQHDSLELVNGSSEYDMSKPMKHDQSEAVKHDSSMQGFIDSKPSDSPAIVDSRSLSDVETMDSTTGVGTSASLMKTDSSEVIHEADIVISLKETPDNNTLSHSQQLCPTPLSNGSVNYLSPKLREKTRPKTERVRSFSNKDIDSLLDTLKSLSTPDDEESEDLKVLEDMLKSNTFKKAKQVHDNMRHLLSVEVSGVKPVVKRIIPISQLMRQHLHHHTEQSVEVNELRELLRAPHVQAALFCHDKVSSHDLYVPDVFFHRSRQDPVDIIVTGSVFHFQETPIDTSVPLSRDVPSTRKEDATIVFLERTNRPLGCTIYKQDEAVFVGKLLKGCDAESSEVLREGDELLEVNGIPIMSRSTDEIVTMMSGDVQPGTTLALTIIPVHDDNIDLDYEPKYVRAHFNYNSRVDEQIPCKALGLSFQKGDIVEISNHDDPDWWQGRKVFDDGAESLPGLIPARHLQQQREAVIRSYPFTMGGDKRKGVWSLFSRKRKKKVFYQQTPPSGVIGVGDEVPTYEDVMRLDPDPSLRRPIVLIGAPGVGRRTLMRKLLNSDPSHYLSVVQHTSRVMRPGELNGHDYWFVSKEEFERDIEQERFLEYGELKGHYYGTALSSIKKIMESGCVPVLDLHPQALKNVRHSGLKPYIVFIGSPRMERLHITRRVGSEKLKRRLGSSSHHMDSHVYTESDLRHLVEESYLIENQYGHYFDWVIINDDFQVAADMLKEVARRLEEEMQWVPALWDHD